MSNKRKNLFSMGIALCLSACMLFTSAGAADYTYGDEGTSTEGSDYTVTVDPSGTTSDGGGAAADVTEDPASTSYADELTPGDGDYLYGGGAMDYTYEGDAPGDTFIQSTSTDSNYIADNGQIVVGTDGTVASGTTGNQTSGPLSSVDLPVGEYPEAYTFQTDVAIANNSVFPNELGPTTTNSNYYTPVYIPIVNSGSLPTGNSYLPTAFVPAVGYYYGARFALPAYSLYSPLTAMNYTNSYYGNGQLMGTATSIAAMPTITKGGAIGRLSISSVGINAYVYEGTSQANMKRGLAHFDCTSGWLGNIGLAGHNRGSSAYFGALKNVKLGDFVTYTTAYGTNTYVVSNITTCATTDTTGLQQNGLNQITMYTCKENQPEVKLCVIATLVTSGV